MAWRDSLAELKEELANVRAGRLSQASDEDVEIEKEREELSRLADSLRVSELLADMNGTLLDGQGTVEKIVSWETDEEDEDGSTVEEEAADVIALILTWEERGERELAIDLGVTDEGVYVQINGIEIRAELEAMEPALLQAFREELEL
jgi:hypothetical protein